MLGITLSRRHKNKEGKTNSHEIVTTHTHRVKSHKRVIYIFTKQRKVVLKIITQSIQVNVFAGNY